MRFSIIGMIILLMFASCAHVPNELVQQAERAAKKVRVSVEFDNGTPAADDKRTDFQKEMECKLGGGTDEKCFRNNSARDH